MNDPSQQGGSTVWPSAGVLLFCAVLLVAGYAVAVLRGPSAAQEVRVVEFPAPTPAPEPAAPIE
jgi:hypothetical protein